MAEEKPKYNCTVSEVTIVNLQPEKNPVLLLAGGKPGSDHRNLGFQPSSPRISEKKLCQGEKKLCPEKVKNEGVLSPSLHRANELCGTESITLKRPVKLAPLEIPLEVKEAQLKKIMSIQREAQMAAQKLMVINAIHNEPHVKRVKNLAQGELANLQKIKLNEKAALESKDDPLHPKNSKPLGEIQIILPSETSSKSTKEAGCAEEAPRAPCRALIPTVQVCEAHGEPGSPEPGQGGPRRRFRARHGLEQPDSGKMRHGLEQPDTGKMRHGLEQPDTGKLRHGLEQPDMGKMRHGLEQPDTGKMRHGLEQPDTGKMRHGLEQPDTGKMRHGLEQPDTGKMRHGLEQPDTGKMRHGLEQLDTGKMRHGLEQLDSGKMRHGLEQPDTGKMRHGLEQPDTGKMRHGLEQPDTGKMRHGLEQPDTGKLRHAREQPDSGRARPLKATEPSVGEGTKQTAGQRTQKTLSDASKLIENVSRKQKERGAKQREMDEASLERRQSIRRMALGDIIQVDDD